MVITDDLDGSPGVETVIFGLHWVSYEIDLNEPNRARLAAALAPIIAGWQEGQPRSPAGLRPDGRGPGRPRGDPDLGPPSADSDWVGVDRERSGSVRLRVSRIASVAATDGRETGASEALAVSPQDSPTQLFDSFELRSLPGPPVRIEPTTCSLREARLDALSALPAQIAQPGAHDAQIAPSQRRARSTTRSTSRPAFQAEG